MTDTPVNDPANNKQSAFRDRQRERLARYLKLRDEAGPDAARDDLLEGYVVRQRARMGPYIEGRTLAAGFRRVLPIFAEMGIQEEIIDVSADRVDAALEILLTCMCRTACAELGLARPLPVLCELDFEATRRAFPGMTVEALRRQVDGAHVCVFRYARPEGMSDAGL